MMEVQLNFPYNMQSVQTCKQISLSHFLRSSGRACLMFKIFCHTFQSWSCVHDNVLNEEQRFPCVFVIVNHVFLVIRYGRKTR